MEYGQFWFNLPVKSVAESKKFYQGIGFTPHPMHHENPNLGGFLVGEQDIVLMLFPESQFSGFTQHAISDTSVGSEVLLNLQVPDREAVESISRLADECGGSIFMEPTEIQGWMYGSGFADPDGHRWNVLFMDMEKAPK